MLEYEYAILAILAILAIPMPTESNYLWDYDSVQ